MHRYDAIDRKSLRRAEYSYTYWIRYICELLSTIVAF